MINEDKRDEVSDVVKQFKLSCSKIGANFTKIELRNHYFAAFIDVFTSNTYIMVVCSDLPIGKFMNFTIFLSFIVYYYSYSLLMDRNIY
ncbi:uncharacterized protein Smp_202170 [Schistosoma mansoni]|uniref:Uncharacterized protein n=1 Tax=Schistosoma mansoni TaxID=6183 RepID=G4VFW0_SCHMA|nr:uncharacterized protein Smp_202170 [Schistosoma mansoni]|eukprot:XP_018651427.1 uncharacterized protein Smp_202170 [Schistosoma mansoni]